MELHVEKWRSIILIETYWNVNGDYALLFDSLYEY